MAPAASEERLLFAPSNAGWPQKDPSILEEFSPIEMELPSGRGTNAFAPRVSDSGLYAGYLRYITPANNSLERR